MAPVVSLLSTYQSKPSPGHLDAVKYVGRYLKATAHYGLVYSSDQNHQVEAYVHYPLTSDIHTMSKPPLPPFQAFVDANWGPQDASMPTLLNNFQISTKETRSICSHILFLCGVPILWKSHKELWSSHSSCEAEIKATDECTKNVRYICNVLHDLSLLNVKTPTTIYNDNQGAIDWGKTTSTKNMHHYNIRESCVQEAIHEFHEIMVKHISSTAML